MTHSITQNRNIADTQSEWDSGIAFGPNTNTYKLMRALLSEADRIDDDLEEIYDQQHINSATGGSLDSWGSLVGVTRENNESDARYRARIKASFRASTTGTTYDEFVQFCAAVLNTDIANITVSTNYDGNPATVTVASPTTVFDSIDITDQDAVEFLGRGIPAGHEVIVLERGTFRLKSDGETDDAALGLTSDSISTGGTLASDLL